MVVAKVLWLVLLGAPSSVCRLKWRNKNMESRLHASLCWAEMTRQKRGGYGTCRAWAKRYACTFLALHVRISLQSPRARCENFLYACKCFVNSLSVC